MSKTGSVAEPTISHMENLDISNIRTLLAVWAHPDDEAYLSAGLMLRVAEAGGRVVCLTATKGEQGTDDPERWPPPQLARHRTRELKAALSRLGVRETWMMDLPDGGCEDAPPEVPTAVIGAAIDTLRPDAIVTFGPDGITGHPDHIAVGRWTTAAWSARRSSASLLYATMTPAFLRRHARLHDRVGFFSMARPRPALDTDRVFKVALNCRELTRKRSALAAHASQTDPLARQLGERAYTYWWRTEAFRLPRPTEVGMLEAAS